VGIVAWIFEVGIGRGEKRKDNAETQRALRKRRGRKRKAKSDGNTEVTEDGTQRAQR